MSDIIEKQNDHRDHMGKFATPVKAVPRKMFRTFLQELMDKYGNVTLGYLIGMYDKMSKEEQFNYDAAGNYYRNTDGENVLDELFKAGLRGSIDVYSLMKFKDTTELKRIQDYLKEKLPHPWIYWEPLEDMHITMVYSKDVNPMEAAEVATIVSRDFDNPSQNVNQNITVDGATVFYPSNGSDGRYVIVLNVIKTQELMDLQQRLFEMTSALMLQSSEFSVPVAWSPHITLAYSEEPIDTTILDSIGGFTLKPAKIDVTVDRQVIGSTDHPSPIAETPDGMKESIEADDFYEQQGIKSDSE